jgi:hypothetical protein
MKMKGRFRANAVKKALVANKNNGKKSQSFADG